MDYLYLLLGLGGLLLGSDVAVRGSVALAHRWNWPGWVTGLLLLALGTSMPELFVCIASAPEYPGLAAGNIFGSNAFNVGLVLGLTLMLKGDAQLNARSVRLPALLPLAFGSLMAFTLLDMPLEVYSMSFLFLLAYAAMIMVSIAARDPELQEEDDATPDTHWNLPIALSATAGGFLMLAVASNWFLDGALALADTLGWAEGFAGFIITAVGTSAPELFTSVRALKLGHAGAVFGNVVGSNAFNLLMAGGSVGLLAQVQVPQEGLLPQLVVNLVATAVLMLPALLTTPKRELSIRTYRVMGGLLVGGYFVAAYWIA